MGNTSSCCERDSKKSHHSQRSAQNQNSTETDVLAAKHWFAETIDKLDVEKKEKAKRFLTEKIGLECRIVEEIYPNLVNIRTEEGEGSGFFAHKDWLVTNAHVLHKENFVPSETQIINPHEGQKINYSVEKAFHRPNALKLAPDLTIINISHEREEIIGVRHLEQQGEALGNVFFYVNSKKEICYLERLDNSNEVPHIFIHDNRKDEAIHGESGSPIFRAILMLTKSAFRWNLNVFGALYARCAPSWPVAQEMIEKEPPIKPICVIPVEDDFNRILEYQQIKDEFEREDTQLTYVKSSEQLSDRVVGCMQKGEEAKHSMESFLKEYEEGLTSEVIDLPFELEKLVKPLLKAVPIEEFMNELKLTQLNGKNIRKYLNKHVDDVTRGGLKAKVAKIEDNHYIEPAINKVFVKNASGCSEKVLEENIRKIYKILVKIGKGEIKEGRRIYGRGAKLSQNNFSTTTADADHLGSVTSKKNEKTSKKVAKRRGREGINQSSLIRQSTEEEEKLKQEIDKLQKIYPKVYDFLTREQKVLVDALCFKTMHNFHVNTKPACSTKKKLECTVTRNGFHYSVTELNGKYLFNHYQNSKSLDKWKKLKEADIKRIKGTVDEGSCPTDIYYKTML